MSKTKLTIEQGATFSTIFRWESSTINYGVIVGVTKAAPAVLNIVGHAIPAGWRGWPLGSKGMTQLNVTSDPQLRDDEAHAVTVSDSNHIALNDVNSSNFGTYTGSGVFAWRAPVDLTGFTARMQIRADVASADILLELTTNPAPGGGTGNARLVVDNTAKTITATISATDTAALTFEKGVFDLELVSAGGTVTRLASGTVVVSPEVTR